VKDRLFEHIDIAGKAENLNDFLDQTMMRLGGAVDTDKDLGPSDRSLFTAIASRTIYVGRIIAFPDFRSR